MTTRNARSLLVASLAATPLIFSWPGGADALTYIELLGKNIFFDEISIPGNKQGCFSCHNPGRGWILPDSVINNTTVVAPGAAPGALGNLKTPSNAYASLIPPFQSGNFGPFVPPWKGGNFWDGRAEGCGAAGDSATCPVANPAGGVSATIRPSDLPASKREAYKIFLGPTADQALNPFPNNVEQNIRQKNVCQRVKTAKYKELYAAAYGEAIDCSPNPKDNPAYTTSFKRLAVALAAWQSSVDVNSFSSKRDKALAADANGKFPLDGLSQDENEGHDLFYGKARCNACHNSGGSSDGTDPKQLYADHLYHNIGVPFNREIPGVAKGVKPGLTAHVTNVATGRFKTPTTRNVLKGVSPNFIKAYTHNGWFKSLKSLVHFYNTRDVLAKCETTGAPANATVKEAKQFNCWPASEFPGAAAGVIGNLGLTDEEENKLVAYMNALTDDHTPTKP